MLAIFTYGFEKSVTAFAKAKTQLHTLSDYHHLLEQAADTNYINTQEQSALENWRKDPANWG
jgi:orotate phosphoribosyltransferase